MSRNKKAALRGGGQENELDDQVYAEFSFDSIVDSALELEARRTRAELDLLGAVLTDNRRLLQVAAQAGIRPEHFSNDDLQLIYQAMIAAKDRDLISVLRLVRKALTAHCFWDPTQIRGNLGSARWSEATVVALANSWFASVAIVMHLAERLIALDRRQRRAIALFMECLETLSAEAYHDEGDSKDGRAAA